MNALRTACHSLGVVAVNDIDTWDDGSASDYTITSCVSQDPLGPLPAGIGKALQGTPPVRKEKNKHKNLMRDMDGPFLSQDS